MALVLILRSRNQLNFYKTSRSNPADHFLYFSWRNKVTVWARKTKVSQIRPTTKPFFDLNWLLGILEEKSIRRGIIVFPGNDSIRPQGVSPFQAAHSYNKGNCCYGWPISIRRVLWGRRTGEYCTSHSGSNPRGFDDGKEEIVHGRVVRGRSLFSELNLSPEVLKETQLPRI